MSYYCRKMVTVSEEKSELDDATENSLREERRRTGRYVATVIAIFVSLFGLYQAMARGTPEYAAFFLPALIMFMYILWILYASRRKFSHNNYFHDQSQNNVALEEIKTVNEAPMVPKPQEVVASTSRTPHRPISRSYSVA